MIFTFTRSEWERIRTGGPYVGTDDVTAAYIGRLLRDNPEPGFITVQVSSDHLMLVIDLMSRILDITSHSA